MPKQVKFMPTSPAALRASLEAHNNAFETLLNLIPPKYYLTQELTEEQVKKTFPNYDIYGLAVFQQAASKYQKHSKKQKAPKQAVKEASKKARRDKVAYRFHVLSNGMTNEVHNKSIVELQQETVIETETSTNGKRKRKAALDPPSDEDGDEEEEDSDDDVDASMNVDVEENGPTSLVPMPSSGSIAELRQKLHQRIESLRRKGKGGEPGDKDELLEERRKQRAAVREKRRKERKEKMRNGKEKEKEKQKSMAVNKVCRLRLWMK
jgi:hypothetical protein